MKPVACCRFHTKMQLKEDELDVNVLEMRGLFVHEVVL
jgi:hypothetical protein